VLNDCLAAWIAQHSKIQPFVPLGETQRKDEGGRMKNEVRNPSSVSGQKFNVSARIDRRTKHSGMKLERDRVA
jgi:hypothetical protein